jgi:hypothetical protein
MISARVHIESKVSEPNLTEQDVAVTIDFCDSVFK